MRKALLFAPMLMLLLTACGGGGEKDLAAELQAQYASLASANLEADITCQYEGEVRTYTMVCAYTPDSSSVTVTAPTNLAGISATVSNGTLTLSYEDVSLDAGSYSAAAISPVAALPKLMEAAGTGYITEQSKEVLGERSCLRLACDLKEDSGTLYTTWFDEETLLPLRSEISADGAVVFEVAWSSFEVTGRNGDGEQTPDTDGNASGGQSSTENAPDSSAGTPDTSTDQQSSDTWTEADEAAAYAEAEE